MYIYSHLSFAYLNSIFYFLFSQFVYFFVLFIALLFYNLMTLCFDYLGFLGITAPLLTYYFPRTFFSWVPHNYLSYWQSCVCVIKLLLLLRIDANKNCPKVALFFDSLTWLFRVNKFEMKASDYGDVSLLSVYLSNTAGEERGENSEFTWETLSPKAWWKIANRIASYRTWCLIILHRTPVKCKPRSESCQ